MPDDKDPWYEQSKQVDFEKAAQEVELPAESLKQQGQDLGSQMVQNDESVPELQPHGPGAAAVNRAEFNQEWQRERERAVTQQQEDTQREAELQSLTEQFAQARGQSYEHDLER